MDRIGIKESLAGIVGEKFVADDPSTLFVYSQDMTENDPAQAQAVVMPGSADEIAEIVRWAHKARVPLIPFVAGANMGGLTIPVRGVVVVDLKRMRGILEVNEEDLYMVVEPGVTFGHVRAYLDQHHPGLRYTYPLSPPHTSVMANALLDGLNNLSYRHGAMSDWIGGIEAVVPPGRIVSIGSNAVSRSWFGRAPLPDMLGLFTGWQGATGIVTKAALQLQVKPPYEKRAFYLLWNLETAYELLRAFTRRTEMDDCACVSWPLGKMLFGAKGKLDLVPGEPTLFIYSHLMGHTRLELAAKERQIAEILRDIKRSGEKIEGPLDIRDLVQINPNYNKLAEFPTTLYFLLDYGTGGLTWVGSYGPGSRWVEGGKACFHILEEMGYPPVLVSRPMKGGHFWVLRFIVSFDRRDPESLKRVRVCLRRMAEALLDCDYIPYKAPGWAAEIIKGRADPEWVALLKRIKKAMDPHGIMNPGRWSLP